jgi:hypothetical protein
VRLKPLGHPSAPTGQKNSSAAASGKPSSDHGMPTEPFRNKRSMKRRHILAGSAAMTLAAPAVRAAVDPKPLTFIPQADTTLLDPSFAPALVTRNHAYMVYATLSGVDDAVRPRPQMAAGRVIEDDGKVWKIPLRNGLRLQDGEKVLARDAVAALKRWARRDVFAISGFAQVDERSAIVLLCLRLPQGSDRHRQGQRSIVYQRPAGATVVRPPPAAIAPHVRGRPRTAAVRPHPGSSSRPSPVQCCMYQSDRAGCRPAAARRSRRCCRSS